MSSGTSSNRPVCSKIGDSHGTLDVLPETQMPVLWFHDFGGKGVACSSLLRCEREDPCECHRRKCLETPKVCDVESAG